MDSLVTIDPDVCNGKPVFSGTRISVQSIVEFLSAGDSTDDVLEQFPALTKAHIEAAFGYASRLAGNHFLVEAVSF